MAAAAAARSRARRSTAALLLVAPAALFMLLLFIYPFLYGLVLSFTAEGTAARSPTTRSSSPTDNLWPTIWTR